MCIKNPNRTVVYVLISSFIAKFSTRNLKIDLRSTTDIMCVAFSLCYLCLARSAASEVGEKDGDPFLVKINDDSY